MSLITALRDYAVWKGEPIPLEAEFAAGLEKSHDRSGIYAYVMLQAYQLPGEAYYLAEARAAIDAARNMRFELNYRANLTAWPLIAVDTVDPRKFPIHGGGWRVMALISLSWLLPVELAADGLESSPSITTGRSRRMPGSTATASRMHESASWANAG